ncbi:SDR family NAD(P)-dependent oxidoreductase [Peribacillus simplex]|uniref:3-oxoacyl-[acyl-carrier protein] reductase n=1 Tax=Peribacillus simplex TaxID=1478 RepID=A0A9X8WJT1_9BACI|nr:SDR family oxidoreductase [Peribacillus simplex]WHY58018.1 SDR family oxidoreductase [Peribacillus simplex]SIQ83031.1 3-oxoacyl-[acyl-carrier protein] reductase [Peribacillus simplex]
MRFSQSIAVVTGAGSGIGKATAMRLSDEGAKVLLVGRTKGKLEEAAAEINARHTIPMADIFAADVTIEEEVKKLAMYVKEQYRDLHILINNAGGSKSSKLLDTSAADWDMIQQVNLKSVFLVSKYLGKVMEEKAGSGNEATNRAIVNVASLSGHQAGAFIPHYSSAKAGVISLTKSLALELAAAGIRVNSVSPGFIETPLTEDKLQNEKFVKSIRRNTALERVGKAEEISNVITFAASPEASYMTGTDLLVDGGWLIK